ncbi:hypothetical protein [Anaerotruncus colihominis]|uniref:Uncharacterized protein n=1 Tax=Anaerotruncus colihominis TaxID=169435 RepID=A0A845SZE5_9FIRM|nr:hypothetical protein [Anaerotruncus colihominis]MCR2027088.1 hypothetical protein [Anaerotruncus colihominis]NDO37661.1 hypothetical protein [Anaerotruncus colihominis]
MTIKLSKRLFLAAAILCVLLRCALKFISIDPATGYYEGYAALVLLFNVLLAVSAFALIALPLLQKASGGYSIRLGGATRLFSALSGAALLLFTAGRILAAVKEIAFVSGAPLSFLLSTLGVFVFMGIVPALSGGILIAAGLRARGQSGAAGMNGWLLLVPLVWQVAQLLVTFMDFTAVRHVSDQMLAVMSMVLGAPFFLAHGRILSGIGHDKGARQMAAFGLSFALLSLTLSIPSIAASLSGRAFPFGLPLTGSILYLCLGLYAAFLGLSIRQKAAHAAGEAN